MGGEELKFTQKAGKCLRRILKVISEKVNVRPQKSLENENHKHAVRHMFSGSFYA